MVAKRPEALVRRIAELPDGPGVYIFKNRDGDPVYIGKALSIRKRVAGHFRFYGAAGSKEGAMLGQTARIDVIETASEADALLLEASMVREQLPRYNSDLRDDKSFPYLKLTAEEFPRLLVTRKRRADGGRYFGPYTSGKLLQQAVKMLRREFPLRTCVQLPKKVCLMYHIGQCGGPCEKMQSAENYRKTVDELARFLEGRHDALVRNLTRRMREYAARQDYERAQAIYAQIRALSLVSVRSARKRDPQSALENIRAAADLPRLPRRIECFDISNVQGREPVGSMTVFIDGAPARAEYRHFRIRTVAGIDDYKMMREVVRRRYSGTLAVNGPIPDLVLIDGGKGHLASARAELLGMGFGDWPLLSIAKQHEHLFSPHREGPVILPPHSPGLQVLRHIRDEAHRFAITYHRRLHRKEAILSHLDRVPGVGPKTKARLLRAFGSVRRIAAAGEEELIGKGGLSEKTAKAVRESLLQKEKS